MPLRFDLDIALDYRAAERSTWVLNIQPARTPQQDLLAESLVVTGNPAIREWTDANGNRFARFSAGPGPVRVAYEAILDLRPSLHPGAAGRECTAESLPCEALPYIAPSRYCESDKLMAFARQQFGALGPGYPRVVAIRDWIRRQVAFRFGSSTWTTSALDTLQQRTGVCRDFSHLMIALCRALNLPARFVTGVDFGADRSLGPMDFHAYVEVFLDTRWYLFDPTGLCPTTGLIRIGTGRDAADVAFSTLFGQMTAAVPQIRCELIARPGRPVPVPVFTEIPVSTADPAIVHAIGPREVDGIGAARAFEVNLNRPSRSRAASARWPS